MLEVFGHQRSDLPRLGLPPDHVPERDRDHHLIGHACLGHVLDVGRDAVEIGEGAAPGLCAGAARRDQGPVDVEEHCDRCLAHAEASASTTSVTSAAASRLAGVAGSGPASTRETASLLPAPVARMITSRAERRTGSVSVMRFGGGLTATTGTTSASVTSSAGSPGNSEAVCPSSPNPSTATSRTGTPPSPAGTSSASSSAYAEAAT